MALNPTGIAEDIYCPQCAYNVRGVVGEVCPECGTRIELERWRLSVIPWEDRHLRGRWRMFWRTVARMSFHPRRVVEDPPGTSSRRAAVSFWLLVSLPLAGVVGFSMSQMYMLLPPIRRFWPIKEHLDFGYLDVIGPWQVGTGHPVLLALSGAFCVLLGLEVAARWCVPRSAIAGVRLVRSNIGLYACAPLLWCCIGLALCIAVVCTMRPDWRGEVLALLTMLIWASGGVLWMLQTFWLWRVLGSMSPKEVLVRALGLIGVLWLLWGTVLPWIAGMIYLMAVVRP